MIAAAAWLTLGAILLTGLVLMLVVWGIKDRAREQRRDDRWASREK